MSSGLSDAGTGALLCKCGTCEDGAASHLVALSYRFAVG